jgi:hypothetical protein
VSAKVVQPEFGPSVSSSPIHIHGEKDARNGARPSIGPAL